MASRLSDVQYGQVMDNLALVANSPSALPHFALTDSGKTLIQSTGQGTGTITTSLITTAGKFFDKTYVTNVNPQVQQLQRQGQDEWDTTPQIDPIQAILMRGLYHKALGTGMSPEEERALNRFFFPHPPKPFDDPVLTAKLETYLECHGLPVLLADSLANYKRAYVHAMQEVYNSLRPGCIHVGNLTDVPVHTCHVAHCGCTYVWVMPEDLECLTNLTLAILDVATTDTAAQNGQTAKPPSLKLIAPPAGIP